MNKVMTRTAQHRPGSRPPGRRDPRRPGGTPPRTPSTGRPGPARQAPPRRTAQAPEAARTAPSGVAGAPGGVGTAPAGVSEAPSGAAGPHPGARPTDLFAERLLAVLSGRRPVHWMLRHTAGPAYDDLARLAERLPLRTRGALPVVRDIGYYVPRSGAIEAFARIGAGDQVRAMAFRLEQGDDLRWRCTAVEVAPRPVR